MRTFSKKRYRYCGKEKDEESGLYYYGARYYMAWACRFISIDPLAADYMHLTPYNYAGNKPITYYDIDGMQSNGEPQSANSTDNITPRPTSQDAVKGEWTDPQSGGRYSYDEGTGAWSETVPKGMEPTVTANMKRFVNGPIDVDAYYMKNSEGTYEQLTGPYSVIEGLTLSGQQVAEEYEKAQEKHRLEAIARETPAAIANYKRQEQEIKRLQWEIASLNNPASALMRLGTDGIKDIARETYDGNYKTAGTLTLLEFGPGKLFKFVGKATTQVGFNAAKGVTVVGEGMARVEAAGNVPNVLI